MVRSPERKGATPPPIPEEATKKEDLPFDATKETSSSIQKAKAKLTEQGSNVLESIPTNGSSESTPMFNIKTGEPVKPESLQVTDTEREQIDTAVPTNDDGPSFPDDGVAGDDLPINKLPKAS